MIASFVAGAYTGTLATDSIGLTKEGYRLRWQYQTDDIDRTDAYGAGTLVEQFYEGVNMWISGIFMEWTQFVLNAVSPYYPWTEAGGDFDLGVISRAASAVASALVLTSTSGTPAASAPSSITAPLAIQDKGFNLEMLFGPTHREVPFMFRIIPSNDDDAVVYLT